MKELNSFLCDASRYIFKASITLRFSHYKLGKPIYYVSIDLGSSLSNMLNSCSNNKRWYPKAKKGREKEYDFFTKLVLIQSKITDIYNKSFNKYHLADQYLQKIAAVLRSHEIRLSVNRDRQNYFEYSVIKKDNVFIFLKTDDCNIQYKKKLVRELERQGLCVSKEEVKRLKRKCIRHINYNIHKYILRLFIRYARNKNKNIFLRQLYYIKRTCKSYRESVIEEIFRHIHNYDGWHETIRTKEDARISSKYLRGVNITEVERKNNKEIIKILKATDYLNETIKAKDII